MAFLFFFVAGVFVLTSIIKLVMSAKAPGAYAALMDYEERSRQRRRDLLKTGIGIASKFVK